ncbi:MAG TPA: flavodoxin family protein [Bacteroidales bacterium]|nr:flavodoxin family protein [Bacteroidales bacterium]
MKKSIVVISSSPRKGGNSDLLCDQFISGAVDSGHNAEKIVLNDKNINYCTGCGYCLKKEGCSQKDDMTDILEKLETADVIVMATPVYFYSMCGRMKTLIDRTCAGYTRISNKEFYFIVAAADSNHSAMERTLEGFRGFTDCLDNPVEKGVIYGTSAWNKGEIKNKPTMKQAYEAGLNV